MTGRIDNPKHLFVSALTIFPILQLMNHALCGSFIQRDEDQYVPPDSLERCVAPDQKPEAGRKIVFPFFKLVNSHPFTLLFVVQIHVQFSNSSVHSLSVGIRQLPPRIT